MSQLSKVLRDAEGGRLLFQCPGCKLAHGPAVGEGPGPRWTWNGNVDAPTFSPSILVTWTSGDPPVGPDNFEEYKRNPWPQTDKKNVCHSFVRDGQIQFLGDCTHALANQTVPLPEWKEFDESADSA